MCKFLKTFLELLNSLQVIKQWTQSFSWMSFAKKTKQKQKQKVKKLACFKMQKTK
jgi:hypothetical protein